MARKKRKDSLSTLPKWVKKSPLTAFIALLIWITYQFIEVIPFQKNENYQIPSSTSPAIFYSNQTRDNLTTIYKQAIDQAQKSITLAIYALNDDQIIQSLQKKSEEGIPIHIICDANATKGITCRLPHATIIRRVGKGLMHQKILIVDDKQVWMGSANLTKSSLNTHGNLVIGIEHPSLAEALTKRSKSMDEDGGFTPLYHRITQLGTQTFEQWVLPDDQGASKRMIDLFRSAKKTIKIAMFTFTRNDFTQELIEAKKRGVSVEAVIDRYNGKGTSAKIVKKLDEAGIPIRLSSGHGLLHHKFVYIDDHILVNGSANWTERAFEKNDDYFVVLYPLTNEQRQKMNELWSVIQKESKK